MRFAGARVVLGFFTLTNIFSERADSLEGSAVEGTRRQELAQGISERNRDPHQARDRPGAKTASRVHNGH